MSLPGVHVPSMGSPSMGNGKVTGNGAVDSRITAQTMGGRGNHTQMSVGGASALSNKVFNPMGSPANLDTRTDKSQLWNTNPVAQTTEPLRSSVPDRGLNNGTPQVLQNRNSGSSRSSGRKKRSSMTKDGNTTTSVKYPTLSPTRNNDANPMNKQNTAETFNPAAQTNYSFSPNGRDNANNSNRGVSAAPTQLSNAPATKNITININNNGGSSNQKNIRTTQEILNEHNDLLNQTVESRDISSGLNRPSRSAKRPSVTSKPQMGTTRESDGNGGYVETTRTPHADGGGYTTTRRVVRKEVVQEKAPFTEPQVTREDDGRGGYVEITKTPWADGTGYTVTKRTVRKLNKTTGVSQKRNSGSIWNAFGFGEDDANNGDRYNGKSTFSRQVIYRQGESDDWLNYRVNPEVFKHSQTYWRDRNQSPYWFDQNGCAYDDEGYLVYDSEGNWYDENGLICEDAMGNQYDYEGNVYDYNGNIIGGYSPEDQTYYYYSQEYINWLNQSNYGNSGWFDFPGCGGGDVYGGYGMSRREEKYMRRKLRKKRGRVEGELEREKRRLKKLKKAVRAEEVAGKREKKERKREKSSSRDKKEKKRSKSEKKEKKKRR